MSKELEGAQSSLCIQDVVLKESNVLVRDGVDLRTLDRATITSQNFRMTAKINELVSVNGNEEESFEYRFLYSVGVRIIFASEEEEGFNEGFKPIVGIIALFESRYSAVRKLTAEELDAFSVNNVGYHVWPYWREYVQSTCARTGFAPSIEVPLYRISKVEE